GFDGDAGSSLKDSAAVAPASPGRRSRVGVVHPDRVDVVTGSDEDIAAEPFGDGRIACEYSGGVGEGSRWVGCKTDGPGGVAENGTGSYRCARLIGSNILAGQINCASSSGGSRVGGDREGHAAAPNLVVPDHGQPRRTNRVPDTIRLRSYSDISGA